MRLTARQLYDRLVNEDNIFNLEGRIKFFLGDVDIVVRQKDVVGNIIQEWVRGWMDKRGVRYAPAENSQMPPDFFLNPDDHTADLLEIKAFNRNAAPGFDIADFRTYQEEIIDKPYMLHVDYLIFGYEMDGRGTVTVKDLWLKKVWQITRRMADWPLNLQVKSGVVHKIRPGAWYGKSKYPMFQSLEHFISAIEQTVYQNPKTRELSAQWMNRFLRAYKEHYGVSLSVERWNNVVDEYGGRE